VRAVFIGPDLFIHIFAPSLSAKISSRVVTLFNDTGSFETVTPNAIAQDLLRFGPSPCVLFINWCQTPDQVLAEANNLCYKAQFLQSAGNLKRFLENLGVAGDAVCSTGLSKWYRSKFMELQQASTHNTLFDPTVLVVETMRDLVRSLAQIHQFDIQNQKVLVPLSFVRSWAETLATRVDQDPSLIPKMTCNR
jgi:hypothetical protein